MKSIIETLKRSLEMDSETAPAMPKSMEKIFPNKEWVAARNSAGSWTVQVGDGPYDPTIAHGCQYTSELTGSDSERDMRLMAAAPELLEACKTALSRCPETSNYLGPVLRAAISKATG